MVEFYKEKIKANLELLKIVASGVTVCALIAGNIAIKDNFGGSNLQFIILTFLLMIIVIGLIISF